jgi:hypothetical protein
MKKVEFANIFPQQKAFDLKTILVQTHKQGILYETALPVFPKNLTAWRDSNTGLLVPKVDAMSTPPRHNKNT